MYQIRPRVRAGHQDARRFVRSGERLLAPAARLLEGEELPQGLRRVVADNPDGPPKVLAESNRLVEKLNALLVAAGGAKNLGHQRRAAKSGLNALRVGPRPRRRGHQGMRVGDTADPVVLLAQHVLLVQPLPRPGVGGPRPKRLFADLAGAVEIARTAPHRETLAEHGPRHRRQLAIIRGLCETKSLFRRGNRLVGVLGPLRSPRVAEERFDPLATGETRQQLAQVADSSRIGPQLRSRQAPRKLDSRSLLVVSCE